MQKQLGSTSKREVLRHLFQELERLRNCISSAATATEETTAHITRAKLLSSVGSIKCFAHVRANPPKDYLKLRSALYDAATQDDTARIKSNTGSPSKTLSIADVMYTDRKYTDRKFRQRKDLKNGHNNQKGCDSLRYAGNNKRCWVCGKDNCHSSHHSREERLRRRTEYSSMLSELLATESEPEDDEGDGKNDSSDSEFSAYIASVEASSFVARCGGDPSEVSEFIGVVLDTACSHVCTISLRQYKMYCSFVGQRPRIDQDNCKVFNTTAGQAMSIGTTKIAIPFGKLVRSIVLDVHVFGDPSTAPLLLSYAVMKKNCWNMLIPLKRLASADDPNKFVTYQEIDGLPVYRWRPEKNVALITNVCSTLFSAQELRNIHRRTGHQSPKRLMKFLECHPHTEALSPDTRAMLHRIVKSCKACQTYAKPPQRFRFVLHDEARFNHVILVDNMKIPDGMVLHVICEGTKYQLGAFIDSLSAQTCWDTLRSCWINVLSGSPDIIRTDAGTSFTGKVFRDNAKSTGIHVEIVPTEAHHKIGLVERYHEVDRKVYEKLKIDDPTMSRELRLSTTFRCINDSAGPNGMVPTLLVFGSYPRLGVKSETIAPTTIERANSIREATDLAESLHRRERIRRASTNGPTANYDLIQRVKKLDNGSPVLVYREKEGWKGPFDFIAADDHGAWVRNEHGNEIRFSLHVVKPYIPEAWSMFARVKSPIFVDSRKKELDGLFSRNAIEIVDYNISRGHRIYRGSWVETLKPDGKSKSRMVICATGERLDSLTYSPTVRRISTRIGFAFASCRTALVAKCRDITQAFVQSDTVLRRPIFLEMLHELRQKGKKKVLFVKRPLYGLPEIPLNWYTTYASCTTTAILFNNSSLRRFSSSGHSSLFVLQFYLYKRLFQN